MLQVLSEPGSFLWNVNQLKYKHTCAWGWYIFILLIITNSSNQDQVFLWEFSGSLEAGIRHFHYCGLDSISGQGTEIISCKLCGTAHHHPQTDQEFLTNYLSQLF